MNHPTPAAFAARLSLALAVILASSTHADPTTPPPPRLKVLFLGSPGPMESHERIADLAPRMLDRNIEVFYSEDPAELLEPNLPAYHAILVFGDHRELTPPHETALEVFVESGGGLVAIHPSRATLPESTTWPSLLGAKAAAAFPPDQPATITTSHPAPDHPLVRGARPLSATDAPLSFEFTATPAPTAIATTHPANAKPSPHTWVRDHGKGRVFATSWGGTFETWRLPAFHDLIERAIRWTSGDDQPADTIARRPLHQPFEFAPARVPYRPPAADAHPDIPRSWPEKQLPLSPAESIRRMILPAGYEVQLFAAEPDIRKAITMNWDDRGRLFVVETLDYPNELRSEGGRDRITICEDTSGDGRADKFTVFADNLNIPTSLAFSNGGVIVHHPPHTLFLKDTTGDDKADYREILFSGWGLRDTHAGPNNLNYGLDNWFWGAVGYSNFDGEVGGSHHAFGNGFYRFRADASEMEFIAQGHRNVYGLGFSEEGDAFGTGANGAPSITLPLPRRFFDMAGVDQGSPTHTYRTARGLPVSRRIRQNDGYGIYTAATGHYPYSARHFPASWRNRVAFVNDPTLGVVGKWILEPDGAAFRSTNPSNLVASDDEYFSPIVSRTGPDGAVWVLDWYNYIIQHNPNPPGHRMGIANAYITDLRDQAHGRVYRIVRAGAPLEAFPPLASAAERVRALSHPNLLWRSHAQRLLVETRTTAATPALAALLEDTSTEPGGWNPAAIHAAWTLNGIGALDSPESPATAAVIAALSHPSPGVRANAAMALPPSPKASSAIVASGILDDPQPRVRLAAFRSLAEQSTAPDVGKAIYAALDKNPGDRWIRTAATAAAIRHSQGFLAQADSSQPSGPLAAVADSVRKRPTPPADSRPTPETPADASLTIGMIPNTMKFDTETFSVRAGSRVALTFFNNDLLEHNLVILKPDSLQRVGRLADQMAAAPDAAERDYVPDTPDILWATRILDPDQSEILNFTAPRQPGRYPFTCTFPGHWQLMHGIMIVTPANQPDEPN